MSTVESEKKRRLHYEETTQPRKKRQTSESDIPLLGKIISGGDSDKCIQHVTQTIKSLEKTAQFALAKCERLEAEKANSDEINSRHDLIKYSDMICEDYDKFINAQFNIGLLDKGFPLQAGDRFAKYMKRSLKCYIEMKDLTSKDFSAGESICLKTMDVIDFQKQKPPNPSALVKNETKNKGKNKHKKPWLNSDEEEVSNEEDESDSSKKNFRGSAIKNKKSSIKTTRSTPKKEVKVKSNCKTYTTFGDKTVIGDYEPSETDPDKVVKILNDPHCKATIIEYERKFGFPECRHINTDVAKRFSRHFVTAEGIIDLLLSRAWETILMFAPPIRIVDEEKLKSDSKFSVYYQLVQEIKTFMIDHCWARFEQLNKLTLPFVEEVDDDDDRKFIFAFAEMTSTMYKNGIAAKNKLDASINAAIKSRSISENSVGDPAFQMWPKIFRWIPREKDLLKDLALQVATSPSSLYFVLNPRAHYFYRYNLEHFFPKPEEDVAPMWNDEVKEILKKLSLNCNLKDL